MFQCDETIASKYTVLDEYVILSSILSELVNQFLKEMESKVQTVISMKYDVWVLLDLNERLQNVYQQRL